MVLCLRAYRVLKAPKGKLRIHQYKVLYKWSNEEAEDLPFDIFKPEEWRKFLKNFTKDGKELLRKTNQGEPVRYQVYYYGTPTYIREHFNMSGSGGLAVLFPGYDKKTKKLLDIIENGWIERDEYVNKNYKPLKGYGEDTDEDKD